MSNPTCPICRNSKPIFFTNQNNYTYYTCPHCNSIFLYPLPDDQSIAALYSNDYVYTVEEKSQKRIEQRSRQILQKLCMLNPLGKTLLDIGSGYGYFIKEAQRQNFNALGIEPAKNLFKYSLLHSTKNVENITFEDFAKSSNKKFDFITLIHVIEHVSKPAKMLRQAFKLLNKNGVIFIETPNIDSFLFQMEQKEYTFLTPPDHTILFSKSSFNELLSQFGNVHKEYGTYSYPEHLMGVAKELFKKLRKSNEKSKSSKQRIILSKQNFEKSQSIKYLVFDRFIAPRLTWLLNLRDKGSFIEVYIQKS